MVIRITSWKESFLHWIVFWNWSHLCFCDSMQFIQSRLSIIFFYFILIMPDKQLVVCVRLLHFSSRIPHSLSLLSCHDDVLHSYWWNLMRSQHKYKQIINVKTIGLLQILASSYYWRLSSNATNQWDGSKKETTFTFSGIIRWKRPQSSKIPVKFQRLQEIKSINCLMCLSGKK